MTITVHLIAAARPNFMKVAPLFHELTRRAWCTPLLVHTGQHYDANMSDAFFADLGLPQPHLHLGVGSGSHAQQTGRVLMAYEEVCLESRPDWVVVAGDVNSTLACTLAAVKLHIPVAHLEAGLRSRDRTMPEEINRVATDATADLLWTPSPDADENLRAEGIPDARIDRVGNIMIDSLELQREAIERSSALGRLKLERGEFGVVTLHRPANVDDREELSGAVDSLIRSAARLPMVFPVHPRTRARLEAFDLDKRLASAPGMLLTEPMGYREFMQLVMNARLVISDSGGVQEETTYLDIPCMTLRPNTERPITVSRGSNELVTVERLVECVGRVLDGAWKHSKPIDLWDGHTAARVAQSLERRALE